MSVSIAQRMRPLPLRRARGRPACTETSGFDALLMSACYEFARHGFEATTVRAIAQRSGVDAALIAHHFGSKAALWDAVVEQIVAWAAPVVAGTVALRDAPGGGRPRERVEQALLLFIDQVFRKPDIGMFFSTAATERGERLDRLVERIMRPYHAALTPLLAAAIAAGELPEQDPTVLYAMVTNGISKTVAYRHVLQPFTSLIDDPAAFKQAVLRSALQMLG